ncbi:MAG TPA: hypothetical protein GX401_03100 [Clostridiales bacterium]|nr:hypothetical protein [Clostridiales bacterium]
MGIIGKVFAEQWIFMVISAVIIVLLFVVKKKAPDFYLTFCKASAVITTVLLIVLAVLFKLPDLFLLVPIIFICCEIFGYNITGKIVAMIFVDFMLIQLIYLLANNNVLSETLMNILFIILQVITAVALGFVMDKHIRKIQADKKASFEKKSQIEAQKEIASDDEYTDFNNYADKKYEHEMDDLDVKANEIFTKVNQNNTDTEE